MQRGEAACESGPLRCTQPCDDSPRLPAWKAMPPGAKYTALGIGSWNSLLYSWAFLRPTAKRPSGMAVLVGPGGARMVASPGRKGTGP